MLLDRRASTGDLPITPEILREETMSRLPRAAACVASALLSFSAAAELKLLVAVDPSEERSGFVQTDEISSDLGRAAGTTVRATKTERLGDAMRSTRTGEYDVYIAPAHVSASALNHGYELVGSTRPLQSYVLVTRAGIKGVGDLKNRNLYLSQQDSVATYMAKGMLNEAGQSLKTFKQVLYKRTTGAGLFAVGAEMVDATVAVESEAQAWLAANPGKAVVLLKSSPVPLGMSVLVKSTLPEPTKARIGGWFRNADAKMPGIGTISNRHEPAPYKYVASLGHFTPSQLPGAKRVSASEVRELIAANAQMVDVRTPKEYNEGHIPGAVLHPYAEKSLKDIAFDPTADSFPGLDKLDKSRPVIFACNGAECWKSYKASKAALAKGFTSVHWFRGGLPEWKGESLPVNRSAIARS
jgi:rhodanese-related sulfurtransferase